MNDLDDFVEGDYVPDPTARLIAFGYYDGATDGLLETHSGGNYRFDFIDEWPSLGDPACVRLLLFRPLPDGTFSRMVELIAPVCEPRVPYWVPSWWDAPPEVKAQVDREVDALLDTAGEPEWIVVGHLMGNEPLRVIRADGQTRTRDEWGTFLGLGRPVGPNPAIE